MTEEFSWSARLGAHLEAARHRGGQRRTDLALELAVSEETIRLWEKGTVQPSADHLAKIIAMLSLVTTELWGPPDREAELTAIARALRVERRSRGITQAEAAEILRVPQATCAGWETARTTPSAYFFPQLAEFLGVEVSVVASLCATPFFVETSSWPPLGRLIGGRRQDLRLERSDLADELGVAANTIAAWELGYRVPGPRQFQPLADALRIDISELASVMPQRPRTSLGELILGRQRQLGLRLVDVAQRAGTTEATVSRWVNGRSKPTAKSMRRLATALEIPYSDVKEAAAA